MRAAERTWAVRARKCARAWRGRSHAASPSALAERIALRRPNAHWTWYVALHLFDAAGNFDSVDPDELIAADLPNSVQVLSEPDTTPVQLRAFVLEPVAIDTSAGDAQVQARLELSSTDVSVQRAIAASAASH
jgi:hypothetical protein